ncbi:hypothetical protein J2W49_004818 [Hydrogenophaga palleronii]|uniref:Ceramidase n=1 Tax=Hydrogenophaga palleronii TaxID=65655 RepID=A0ABU1WU84_9BURK|nr:hypothetical protein [Hydrogenophaga palleronii]MDR7152840.1 hypothetical protein [Hydrogenophaga palleronii]
MTSQARPVHANLAVRRRMPKSPVEQRLCRFGLVLLALWLLAAVLGPVLLTLPSHGLEALHPHGHPFVDARMFWGIPNFMDVLSNAPLFLAGALGVGVLQLQRGTKPLPAVQLAMTVFFVGLMLTGLGSAWYHWAPDAQGLVLDRLGMAVTFAGALALAVSERVSVAAASVTLRMSLMVALLSAVMPLSHDNVWPWAVVQFGGMALMGWLSMQKPVAGAMGVRIGVLLALYAVAKMFELGDAAVFLATGELVSGHTLKHLVAALAVFPVVMAVRQNARAVVGAPAPARASVHSH